MTVKEKRKCRYIIHTATIAAGAIGAAKLPGSDMLMLSAIQGTMIMALGNALGVSVTKNSAKEMAKTFMIGKIGKGMAGMFLQAIPAFGNAINSVVAAALTEMLGWDTVKEFEERRKAENKEESVA